jgi:predicted transcriptional regulator
MTRPSTPRKAPPKRAPAELIISLDEFASLVGVTPETMRTHLKQAPDGAEWLLERGRRGVGYKILATKALAWWRDRKTGDGADDLKQRQLAELRLQMLGDAGDDEGLHLTGKQRYEEFKAGQAELDYREQIGELCRVATWEGETANAVIELRRQLQRVGKIVRRKFGLKLEVEEAIDEILADRLEQFVKALDADERAADG